MPTVRKAQLRWSSDEEFLGRGADPDTPEILIDGNNATAPGPMQLLLLGAASCSAVDVIQIMSKMRQSVSALRVDVEGERRDEVPRRYTSLKLIYHLKGPDIQQSHAERAVQLAVEKYCSVIQSLSSDVSISHQVLLD